MTHYERDERLHTKLVGIDMCTPVLAASGTFGFGEEFADFVDLARLGGVMVKGTTLHPRRGNDGVRIAETPQGMLNCIGLENPGVDVFLQEILPRIRPYGMNVIVNISGSSIEDYAAVAERLNVPDVAAIEINISCPNVKEGGIVFGTDPNAAAAVVRAVRSATQKPVVVKLSPNVTSIAEMARAVEAAGADMISLINTLIGMGGITSWEDAAEFFLAGASAVAVGTANFTDPTVTMKICDGLLHYMEEHGISHIREIVGMAQTD